jgi:hypothetical protein
MVERPRPVNRITVGIRRSSGATVSILLGDRAFGFHCTFSLR